MIKLGNKVRDNLTGFTGIAVGRTEWLYGCARIGVDAVDLKDGKPMETVWFDEQRLEVLDLSAPKVSPHSSATTGGPMDDAASRRADPSR